MNWYIYIWVCETQCSLIEFKGTDFKRNQSTTILQLRSNAGGVLMNECPPLTLCISGRRHVKWDDWLPADPVRYKMKNSLKSVHMKNDRRYNATAVVRDLWIYSCQAFQNKRYKYTLLLQTQSEAEIDTMKYNVVAVTFSIRWYLSVQL